MSSSLGYTIKANIYCCFCVVSDYCLFSYRSRFFFAMGGPPLYYFHLFRCALFRFFHFESSEFSSRSLDCRLRITRQCIRMPGILHCQQSQQLANNQRRTTDNSQQPYCWPYGRRYGDCGLGWSALLAAQQAANNQVHNCHKAKKRGLRSPGDWVSH